MQKSFFTLRQKTRMDEEGAKKINISYDFKKAQAVRKILKADTFKKTQASIGSKINIKSPT